MLDNEAIQALASPAHPQHREVVSQAQVVASRKRRAAEIQVVVPTTVRVEAGWDRTGPAWALPNRLRIADASLATVHGNAAAAIRNRTGVSVADAHVGAVIESARADRIAIVTSDPNDMRLVAGGREVTIVVV